MTAANTLGFEDPESFWNDKLRGEEYHFGRRPNEFLTRIAPTFPAAADVLCVADGEGRNSAWLAQLGHRVTAFDISTVGLGKARKLSAELGVSVDYHQSSVENWHWTAEQYNVVVAIFIQFTPPAKRRWLWQQIHTTLRPNGLLVIQGYSPTQLIFKTGGPSNVEHLYTEALLKQELSAFKELQCSEYEQVLREGPGHNGRSALVGAVARK